MERVLTKEFYESASKLVKFATVSSTALTNQTKKIVNVINTISLVTNLIISLILWNCFYLLGCNKTVSNEQLNRLIIQTPQPSTFANWSSNILNCYYR